MNSRGRAARTYLDSEVHKIAARRFEELFQGLPVACCTCDADGTIFESNREFAELTGYTAAESTQRPIFGLLGCQSISRIIRAQLDATLRGEDAEPFELNAVRKSGRAYWALVHTLPFRAPSGVIGGAIFACTDITDRKELESRIRRQMEELAAAKRMLEKGQKALKAANDKLKRLASTDSLTGIANRRVFRERLDAAVDEANSHGEPLSLIFFDADKFKSYNDSYGHQAGDEVLRMLASLAKACVRSRDILARFGGEEFVIVLPKSDRTNAVRIAERVRAAIEAADWPHRSVTASFGVATSIGPFVDARELIERADEALYASKEKGRNRTSHWDDQSGTAKAA